MRYCIQNVKDGIQIPVYNIINDKVHHSSQFISVKVEKKLRKSQAKFREKLRKLRRGQNNDFLIKKTCKPFAILEPYTIKSLLNSSEGLLISSMPEEDLLKREAYKNGSFIYFLKIFGS